MNQPINNSENLPRSPVPKRAPLWLTYGAAAALAAATLFVRLTIGFIPADRPTPFLFLIPIIISAYLGGLGPGLLCTALSAFFVNYFLMEPIYTFSIKSGINKTMWATFIIEGILLSVVNEALHRSRRRAEKAFTELQRAEEALRRQEQDRAEEILRQSEHQLEIALRAARMVSFFWDPVSNVMKTRGDFAGIFGRPPLTKSEEGFALAHPEDRQRHRATIEQATRQGGAYVMEYRIIRPDNGSVVWIEDRADVLLDEAGRAKLLAGTAVDVTQRKQMEGALRESEQKFSVIYDKAAFAIALARLPEGVIVDVNEAWVKMYGYSKQEAVGRTSLELGINRNPDGRARLFAELQQKGSVRNMEASFYTKSGARLVVSYNIDVVELGAEKYLLSTMHDITAQKQAEEVLRRSRAELEQLVAERTAELSAANETLLAEIDVRRRAEGALQEAEARLRLALQAGRIGTWDWDMVTGKIVWSRSTEELWGLAPGVFKGTYAEFDAQLHPDDREDLNHAVAQAVSEHRSYQHEFRIIRLDGSIRWIAGRGEPFFDDGGRPVRMIGVVIDITERKQAEERLREYEKAMEGLEEMIVVVDRNYRYVIANRAFLAYQGLTRDELVGHFAHELLNKDVSEKVAKKKLDECFQGNVVKYELRYAYPQLGERDLFIQYFPIQGPKGIDRVACIFQDITERKQAEEAIRKSEERFQLATRATHDVVWDWDLIANTVWWNENFKTLFGYRPEEIEPGIASWKNRLHPEDKERISASIHAAIEEGKQFWSDEYRFRRADGSDAIILDHGYVIRDEQGKAIRMIGAMTDMTERKRAEEEIKKLNVDLERRVAERTAQLETANKELESFSYSVSHDLRAPLRGISGFSQVLLAKYLDRLDPQGKDFLQRVDAASRRMGELIEDLLNLSRVTRSEMRREPVDLTLLARSIAAELQQAEPERKLTFLIQDDLKTSADPRLLKIVLENLLGNAFKFTSKQPTATVEFGRIEKNGKPVYFIRDNGAGFDMAYADKLFGPFKRLHSLKEFAGTGIGLATVQRIIHRHGGKVWAEGEVEKGATFYFTI